MRMTYLKFFIHMMLLTSVTTNYAFPRKCYVKTGVVMMHINCPNYQPPITGLPTGTQRFVDQINLSQNQIQTVRDLSNFPMVSKINLTHNLIKTFPWASLKNLPSLRTLDLSHNQLSSVRLDLAATSSPWLSVAYNKLATFSKTNLGIISKRVRRIRNMYVQGNPVHCDCRMAWLAKLASTYKAKCWLQRYGCPAEVDNSPLKAGFSLSDDFKCSTPDNFKDSLLHDVTLPECQLTTTTNVYQTTVVTTIAQTTTLPNAQSTANDVPRTVSNSETKRPMTIPKIRQVETLVTNTMPKIAFSSPNGNDDDQQSTRPTTATNETHVSETMTSKPKATSSLPKASTSAPKVSGSALEVSSSFPKAAIVAISVVATLLFTLAIAAFTIKFIRKRQNLDQQDGKGQGVELSKTSPGPDANP
uniref:LRRCT domain-containing protein n=1 Tax=Branchiostoma floridae TaxID=7739 RepID=C3ZPT7_BRAFL|eukprot:XP_002589305.1 hypothetical protein BRAFLDRAFT_97373 [Branchiostoma floridae]